MAPVKVPKTPKSSFNKHRPPSALLLDQIRHLEWAVLPASQRKPHQLPKSKVRTEEEAARRIAQLTAMVLEANAPATAPAAAVPSGPPTPVKLPPIERQRPAARKKRPSRSRRKTTSAARSKSAASKSSTRKTSASARARKRRRK